MIGMLYIARAIIEKPILNIPSPEVRIERNEKTIILWDSKEGWWLRLPNCALISAKDWDNGMPCDDFSGDGKIRIQFKPPKDA